MYRFTNLLSPISLGTVRIRNRVYITSHATGLADSLENNNKGIYAPSEDLAYYYAERARGGVGLIIMEAGIVHYSSEGLTTSHLYDSRVVPGLRRVSEMVHSHGAKIFAQLYHGGHHAANLRSGLPTLSASQVPSSKNSYVIPAAMSKADIHEIIEGFAVSAKNVERGGFDGVELHGTHGYLIEQFLSPHFNKRTDEYGGSLENRLRFLREIAGAVKTSLDPTVPLGCRFMANELLADGIDSDQAARIASILEGEGWFDFLDVDIGISGRQHHLQIAPLYVSPGHEIEYIERIKRSLKQTPILGCPGRCADPILAESLIAGGKMDMVAMTRAHIADPEIVKKTQESRLEDIRPCIGTNEQCFNRITNGSPLRCNVNAAVGYEKTRGVEALKHCERSKKVLVVGAGPAGLEAARISAIRGHNVVIYEKEGEIGGQVKLAKRLPGRDDVGAIVAWYETQLRKLGVEVKLRSGIPIEPELLDYLVDEEKPDVVVVATGSHYDSSGYTEFAGTAIKTVGKITILTPEDVLSRKAECGKKIVILDDEGFEVGPCLAEKLSSDACSVEMVTRFYMLGSAMLSTLQLPFIYERLFRKNITIHTCSFVNELGDRDVIVYNVFTKAMSVIKDVDTFIPITAKISTNTLYNLFKARVQETYLIGDAVSPRRIHHAIVDGYNIGLLV